MKKIFKLLIFVLIANAAYRFAPPYIHYTRFKQQLPDLALQAKGKSDWVITSEVLQLAAKHKIPLEHGGVQVRRTSDLAHTYIDAEWVETIEFVPAWKYPMRFTVMADGWHIKPTIIDDLTR